MYLLVERLKFEAKEMDRTVKKNFDCSILYDPGKANVVAYALSRKSAASLAHISTERRPII